MSRSASRALNHGEGPPEDGAERERDICPDCGAERWQLVIVPERFYCDACKKAGPGPNGDAPAPKPEQIDLFGEPGAHVMVADGRRLRGHDDFERAPVDEVDAWMAAEMPDE